MSTFWEIHEHAVEVLPGNLADEVKPGRGVTRSYTCDVTRSYMWRELFIHVTWLVRKTHEHAVEVIFIYIQT